MYTSIWLNCKVSDPSLYSQLFSVPCYFVYKFQNTLDMPANPSSLAKSPPQPWLARRHLCIVVTAIHNQWQKPFTFLSISLLFWLYHVRNLEHDLGFPNYSSFPVMMFICCFLWVVVCATLLCYIKHQCDVSELYDSDLISFSFK